MTKKREGRSEEGKEEGENWAYCTATGNAPAMMMSGLPVCIPQLRNYFRALFPPDTLPYLTYFCIPTENSESLLMKQNKGKKGDKL